MKKSVFIANQCKHGFNILIIGLLIFLIYRPGLNGQFQFDDIPNIVYNERVHIESLSLQSIAKSSLSGNSGILKRPISMLTFAVNYYLSGLNPTPYKLTNVFIHISNACAIYWLCILLQSRLTTETNSLGSTRPIWFASFITLAWAIHPINLTSVLYVVQRMTSLSAFFSLTGMILYVFSRNALTNNHTSKCLLGLLFVLISGVFSILSKENGALLFLYLLLIELTFYRKTLHTPTSRLIIAIFFGVTLAIPSIFIAAYSLITPEWLLNGYAGTSFTLFERILTEFRVLWYYIAWILLPRNQSLGLFHDDIALSNTLFDTTYPLIALLAHLIVISSLFFLWIKNKQTLIVFGCGLFYTSHLIESTALPLELVHEHRNYLGSFGLLLAVGGVALSIYDKAKRAAILGAIFYVTFLALITLQRVTYWGNGIEGAIIEAEYHPNSAAAHYEIGRQYISMTDTESTHFQEKALQHFQKAAELDKSRADSIFAIIITSARNKTAIDPNLLQELIFRLKNGPAYASHASWLSTLVNCYIKAQCTMEETQVVNILQAALDNKNLQNTKLTESITLMTTSAFLTSGGKNYENALELSIIAAESSPGNIIFIRNIIDLSLAFKDFITATKWLKHFEDQPYAFLFTQEIKDLKNKIPPQSNPINPS